MERTHLSTTLLTRLLGLYIILQGVRVLLTRTRGENVGIYKLGIFIPVTDLGILLYGSAFTAVGLAVYFLIPSALLKLSSVVLKSILLLLAFGFGLVLGGHGVELFFTSDFAVSVEVLGLIVLTSMRDLLLGGTAFILLGWLFFAAAPAVLYRTRAGVATKGGLKVVFIASAIYISCMGGFFFFLSDSQELMSAERDLRNPQPAQSLDRYLASNPTSRPHVLSGDVDAEIPPEIQAAWEEAKTKPNETTILSHKGTWFIYPKQGYLVSTNFEVEKETNSGVAILVKAPESVTQSFFPVAIYGYTVHSLVVQERTEAVSP